MDKDPLSSISQADALEKIGEFWDTHDFTDFDDPNLPDVEFEIRCAVPIELDLLASVEKQARLRGVKVETIDCAAYYPKLGQQTAVCSLIIVGRLQLPPFHFGVAKLWQKS